MPLEKGVRLDLHIDVQVAGGPPIGPASPSPRRQSCMPLSTPGGTLTSSFEVRIWVPDPPQSPHLSRTTWPLPGRPDTWSARGRNPARERRVRDRRNSRSSAAWCRPWRRCPGTLGTFRGG